MDKRVGDLYQINILPQISGKLGDAFMEKSKQEALILWYCFLGGLNFNFF